TGVSDPGIMDAAPKMIKLTSDLRILTAAVHIGGRARGASKELSASHQSTASRQSRSATTAAFTSGKEMSSNVKLILRILRIRGEIPRSCRRRGRFRAIPPRPMTVLKPGCNGKRRNFERIFHAPPNLAKIHSYPTP